MNPDDLLYNDSPLLRPALPSGPGRPVPAGPPALAGEPGATGPILDPEALLRMGKNLALLRGGLAIASGTQGLFPSLQTGADVALGTYEQGREQAMAAARMLQRQRVLGWATGKPGESPAETYGRVAPFVPQVMALGDPDLTKAFVEYANNLGQMAEKSRPQVVTPRSGGGAFTVDPTTGQVVDTISPAGAGANPPAPGRATNVLGPDGKPYTVLYDRDGKEVARYQEWTKPESQIGQYTPSEYRQILGQYFSNGQVKDLMHRGSQLGAAYAAMKSAQGGNWAAYASTISKYVQAVDQDKNLRQGMLEYFEQGLAPSVYQRTVKALDKGLYGQLPPEALRLMAQHADEMNSEFQRQMGEMQGTFSALYPGIKFPGAERFFPAVGGGAAAGPTPVGPSAAEIAKKYGGR